jgi:cytoskeletal protein CcmA (bactofilin family)
VLSNPTNNAQSNLPKPPNGSTRFAPEGTASAWSEGCRVDPAATTGFSVIGNDLTILGEKITIISQDKLQVSGQIHGDVHGKQVMISTGGSVIGKVCAEKIEVRGEVRGSIRALTVALHESAKVDGDIMHQTLSISEGAEFNGRVQRAKDTSELIPILDAEAFASQSGSGNGEASHYGRDNDKPLGDLVDEI